MAKLLFDHYMVLMLENRSFDHLFGYLGKGDGVPAGAVNYKSAGNARSPAFLAKRGGDFTAIGQGPSHSLKETNVQLFGTSKPKAADPVNLDGFIASFATSLAYDLKRAPTDSELQQAMNGFDPVQLPVLSSLAENFVLCDRWFADVPGPTMPNRAFVHAATSQGYTWNAKWKPQFTCKTIYDRIGATDKLSWRVYYHDQNDVLELYPSLKSDSTNHARFETNFLGDVSGDNLATYSFITPAFIGTAQQPVNSMHAPADVRPAEKLVADVYSALRAHPDVWKKTLLIVVFDEHGGYFDHVPPPATVSPDGIAGRMDQSFLVPFDFSRLGLRVPAILISPWFEAAVDSTVYSHSTIPGTLIDALDLSGGYLTKRDKAAAKLTAKYLIDDGKRVWRSNTPDVSVPEQPTAMDALQREMLAGSVHLDPHPQNRDEMRTKDIQDPNQAKQFIRTQVAKNIEHRMASRNNPQVGKQLSADNQLPATSVSAARIAELQRSKPKTRRARKVKKVATRKLARK
jgi:phospholipase C